MAGEPEEVLAPLPSFSQPDTDNIPAPAGGDNAKVPPGSGVIDPPTDSDEMSFVLDAMEQLDAPPAEEQPAPQQAKPTTPQAVPQPAPKQAGDPPVVIPPVPGQQPQPQPVAQPAQVVTQPVVPPPAQPTQQSQPSVAPGQELAVLAQKMEQQRENFIQKAAQSYENTFSDEDIEEIQTQPKKAFSKMAARLHADVVQNVLTMMTAQLPSMILGLSEAQHTQRAAKDAFWRENPDLQAHADKIIPMAQALRTANPNLDAKTFQSQLASWARMTLGVAPPVQSQQPLPRAPARGARAFTPAPAGRPAQATQPVASDNPWEKIDQIMDAENRGVMDR